MLPKLRSRRRLRYSTYISAIIAAVLLLISVTILYIRLTNHHHHTPTNHHHHQSKDHHLTFDPLLEDSDPLDRTTEEKIDEFDDTHHDQDPKNDDDDDDAITNENEQDPSEVSSKYYFDHALGVIRRAFDKRSIDQWEDYDSFVSNVNVLDIGFGSDDVVLDENVRKKLVQVKGIEDALLLSLGNRVSPLKEGWGNWFDKKSDFLRRDRMFKSMEMIFLPSLLVDVMTNTHTHDTQISLLHLLSLSRHQQARREEKSSPSLAFHLFLLGFFTH